MENDLEVWEMASIFWKWFRYMGHGLSISETTLLCWKWLKNSTKILNMWEMTYIYIYIWEIGLKYLKYGLNMWELT